MRILMISFLFLLFGCGAKKNECVENLNFKEKFFKSITDVENTVFSKKEGSRQQYDEGLFFLSKYVNVDYSKTLNYRNVYTFKGFNDDKVTWLKWYEENKCSNIKFKE